MNDAQHAALEPYIRDLADRLLLRDWEIVLSRQMAANGRWAEIHISQQENLAVVRVQHPEFWGEDLEDQREHLTHEIMHLHLARLDGVMTKLKGMLDSDAMMEFAGKCFDEEHEIATQRLARCIAPLMPLPPAVRDL